MKELGLANYHKTFLMFGTIRRYKGVPGVIRQFSTLQDPDARLIVAGKPYDSDLESEIRSLAETDPRVILRFGHIADEDVAPLMRLARAVLFGFERTLTSGSVLLAMSFGNAVILPELARSLDVIDADGAVFYSGEEGLKSLLPSLTAAKLKCMGDHNFKCASLFDWSGIGAAIAEVYGGRPVRFIPKASDMRAS